MKNPMQLVTIGLLVVLVQACTSMNYNVPQQTTHGINSGANHLNTVVDKDLPSQTYTNCSAGEWSMRAGTSNEGNTFSGHASQKCAPVITRGSGYNTK